MRIGGVEVTKCEEVLVLPRMNGDLVFKAVAVCSMDKFNDLCPKPEPPMRLKKGGVREPHLSDDYIKTVESWSQKRYAFICINSLIPSDITWDEVDYDKPNTWVKWMEELEAAGLADVELQRVQSLVLDANALNEAKLKAARESFLLGQGQEDETSSGLQTTPESSPSGKPASE
jgi:hypothetical protein